MSSLIPPMLSDSPPPLDVQLDDNDDDNGFGDFRVATELGFDLSDSSIGRDSPEVWNTPSTNSDSSEDRLAKISKKPPMKKDEQSVYFDTTSDLGAVSKTTLNVDMSKCDSAITPISNDAHIDALNLVDEKVPDNQSDEDEDPPELTEELKHIPFPAVFHSCDVLLEARTSPEGADADPGCTGEDNGFDFRNSSVTAGCGLSISETNISVYESGNPVSVALAEAKGSECVHENDDDFNDFSDFADFSSQPFPVQSELPSPPLTVPSNVAEIVKCGESTPVAHPDDDFDDFDDFECAALPAESPATEEEDMNSKLAAIFVGTKEPMLDTADPELTGCLHACLDDSSSVWGHLKDLETSHALKLQWNASFASRKLLSSLGVDSRNILIGPRWNSSMPRFAANLGCTPLEPMKAKVPPDEETPPPLSAVTNRVSVAVSEDVVPVAQFDWNSSGLTNPLDCMEKEESPISREPSELMVKNDTDLPASQLWASTDILLPSPVLITTDISPCLSKQSDDLTKCEVPPVLEEHVVGFNTQMENGEESKGSPVFANEKSVSTEAMRVVENLPDLSFLSARKLLYAANENMSRFQAMARP